MSEENNLKLMFLASQRFDDEKSIRGAFLLTDIQTKPLEFRCTNPIRPSPIQAVLYGSSLQQHVMVELIGIPLFNSLKEKPSLVLVKEPDLLGIRAKISIPVVQLAKEESIPISTEQDRVTQTIRSSSGRFDPVILLTHTKFPSDREQAKVLLNEVFNSHDVMEPFSRIAIALEQVHTQKIGEEK